jgi:membrane-bound lytic murein transglycosylase F
MVFRNLVRRTKDAIVFVLFVVLLLFTGYLLMFHKPVLPEPDLNDCLHAIMERDTLIAITDNSTTSYFLYKGQPMGYQYELLNHLADHLGVALKIVISGSIEESILQLSSREADLIAMDLSVNAPRQEILSFTEPIHQTRQVLVQRIPDPDSGNGENPTPVRKPSELAGKTIHIQKNSSHRLRIRNIAAEIGAGIDIVEESLDSEELITMVADGEIEYTVTDQHVAMANKTWYDNIDISTEISLPLDMAWAVRPGSDSLLAVINEWITDFIHTRTYERIFKRYFVSKKSAHLQESEFHSVRGGKLSKYDDLIRKHSKEGPWDWRLVAAVIYEESRFNPRAQSWAGATGLMQLMPNTARRFGVKNINNPKEQLKGGVALISYLNEKLPDTISDPYERAKYVLACYNIGMSHILDAINLALKYGEDPALWETGEKYLLLKSKPKYFNDPVVRAGYARGRETRRFVEKVMQRYHHYRSILPE